MITFTERPESGRITSEPPGFETIWNAHGSNSREAIWLHARASSPFVFNHPQGATLYRQKIEVQPITSDAFAVTIPYAVKKREQGNWSFSFDTQGGTLRVKRCKSLVAEFVPAGVGKTGTVGKGKLIGANGDNVEGVDIVIPALKFEIGFTHPSGEITLEYAKTIADLTGIVNDATFGPFAAGNVLFLGARGSDGREAEASVNYSFVYSVGTESETIDDIAAIDKKGHEVLDVIWEDAETNNEADKKARRVYIHRVYDEQDFDDVFPFTL